MAKERERRYGSACDLAEDIRRHLSHQPVLATSPAVVYKMRCFMRRHLAGVLAGLVVAFTVLAGFTTTAVALFQAREAEARALASAKAEGRSAKRAGVAFSVLENILASPDPFASGRDIRLSELLQRFPENLPGELVDEEAEGLFRHTIGRTYANLGEYESACNQLEAARAIRGRTLGPLHPKTMESGLVPALMGLGRLYQMENRPTDAKRVWAETIGLGRHDPLPLLPSNIINQGLPEEKLARFAQWQEPHQ